MPVQVRKHGKHYCETGTPEFCKEARSVGTCDLRRRMCITANVIVRAMLISGLIHNRWRMLIDFKSLPGNLKNSSLMLIIRRAHIVKICRLITSLGTCTVLP